ncbi:processed acidic surface protein [Pseudalkalibacillus sp. Hm43]|uniref:processed acidic surface protein n=1 Tax=Pseudalkalibacillus sp. Hm43 TaxID=3450742 RepID=UPI003F42BAB1
MKHVLAVVLTISLIMVPMTAFAAIEQSDLDAYLKSIGWTQEMLEEELSYSDMTLDDFETIEELQEFIGNPLTEENLQEILANYDLTREELNELLVESGELEVGQDVLEVFTIYEELDGLVGFYLEVETETPITEESLQELLDLYEITYEELVELFEENGDSIEAYEFIEELELSLIEYMYGDELLNFEDLFTELGLTEAELEALFNHLMTLNVEDPALEAKMMELSDRMLALGDFETAEELTKEQVAEMAAIMTEMFNLMELDAKFYLVKDGQTTPITLAQMLEMSEEEAAGYSLLIELYNLNGEMILDMLITADMVSSELIEETAQDLKTAGTPTKAEKAKPIMKTEKGAKMPKTAGNYVEGSIAGLGFLLVGLYMIRRLKIKKAA